MENEHIVDKSYILHVHFIYFCWPGFTAKTCSNISDVSHDAVQNLTFKFLGCIETAKYAAAALATDDLGDPRRIRTMQHKSALGTSEIGEAAFCGWCLALARVVRRYIASFGPRQDSILAVYVYIILNWSLHKYSEAQKIRIFHSYYPCDWDRCKALDYETIGS